MRARRIAWVLIAGLVVPPAASAQPEDGEPQPGAPAEAGDGAPVAKDAKAARAWQQKGKQLTRQGDASARRKKADEARRHYEDALSAYRKALELGADLELHHEMAGIEEKLGRLDAAARHYRAVIAAKDVVRADILKKAKARYDELTLEIGLVAITVVPEGATISLGGTELARSPMSEPVALMPGTYTLSFAADGYQPKDLEIKVEAGSESERTIELEPIPVIVEAPPPPPKRTVAPTPREPSKLPLYVGGGVAVGLTTVGIVTGIVAVSKHGTFTADDSTPNERDVARSSGKTLAVLTDVSLGVAAAAAGFTAYWYFARYKPATAARDEARETSALSKVDVVPWVQLDGGGVSVAGSF